MIGSFRQWGQATLSYWVICSFAAQANSRDGEGEPNCKKKAELLLFPNSWHRPWLDIFIQAQMKAHNCGESPGSFVLFAGTSQQRHWRPACCNENVWTEKKREGELKKCSGYEFASIQESDKSQACGKDTNGKSESWQKVTRSISVFTGDQLWL